MNTQLDSLSLSALDRLGQRLLPGQARRVGHGVGELTVLAGRIWVTGHDDGEDEVLGAGQRLRLIDADRVVIESFDAASPAHVAWRPRRSVLQRFAWRDFGALFAALARKAAPSARRAQGCMP